MSDEWQIAVEVGGNDVLLFDGETTLGRSDESDVVLADSSVSRVHAMIRVEGGQVSIRDLGSSNGTKVGDEEIEGEVELNDGDRIQLGDRLAILRIRSLLSDLEGGSTPPGGAEPAVGSATTMLQKASLDLAMKAQMETFEDEADLALHRRPTEIRPISIPEPVESIPDSILIEEEAAEAGASPISPGEHEVEMQSPATDLRNEVLESGGGGESSLDPAATMWVPAMDLRNELAAATENVEHEEVDKDPASTLEMHPEDLRTELGVVDSPVATMKVDSEEIQAEMAAVESPASRMQVPIASASEPESDVVISSSPIPPPIPEAGSSETSALGRVLARVRAWFSARNR